MRSYDCFESVREKNPRKDINNLVKFSVIQCLMKYVFNLCFSV